MKDFKIYGYSGVKRVLITNSAELSSAATYDEVLSLMENKQATLTFNIMENLEDDAPNQFNNLIYPGGRIYLQTFDLKGRVKFESDFIITSYVPTFYEKNTVYSVGCNDYASAIFSKEGTNLSLEKTGNIEELAEHILGETRKNPYYKNLGNNYWLSINIKNLVNVVKNNGVLLVNSQNYDTPSFEYDLRNSALSTKPQKFIFFPQVLTEKAVYANPTIRIEYLNSAKSVLKSETFECVVGKFNEHVLALEAGVVYLKFTVINSPRNLYLKELGIKIIPNQEELNSFWRISPTFDLNDFTSDIITGTNSIFKRVTISLSNSNLYNALIEVANLFNAELDFDYNNKWINFINKNKRNFKGYKINPNLNLKTISREENTTSFSTAMSVTGGESNDAIVSLIPTMPTCIRTYFLDCIDHNFGDFPNATPQDKYKYFNDYSTTKYIDIVKEILPNSREYISSEDYEMQKEELIKFAKVCDLAPSYDNRIYDISYFYNDKKKYLTEAQFREFNDIINNILRKNNIKLNIYSYEYYQILTELSMLNSEIDFLTENLVTEEIYLHEVEDKLAKLDKKYENTKTQWTIKEKISSTMSTIDKMKEELNTCYGIAAVEQALSVSPFVLPTNSFPYYLIQIEGYSDKFTNAFTKALNDVNTSIENKQEEYSTTTKRLAEIDKILAEGGLTDYKKRTLETERSGLLRQKKRIEKEIGYFPDESAADYNTRHYGSLLYKRDKLNQLYNMIEIKGSSIGLYDYIVNYESPYNVNREKDLIIADLYNRYEQYTIEGYYENSDELDSYGLMEQSKFIFDQNKYPTINYSLSVIDLSVLEDYRFLDIAVGDKIVIDDKKLYKSYNPNEPKYLIISGIQYTLRDASATTLTVAKADEEMKLLQKLLLGITN